MTSEDTNDTFGNREIADLLPWYATGRLSPEDCARVDAALDGDAALRMELELVHQELAETIAYNEAQGAPSRRAAETFFAALDASPRGRARVPLLRRIGEFVEGLAPRTLAFSGAAAFALVLLQAGVITHLVSQRSQQPVVESQLASVAPTAKIDGPVVIVEFTAGAKLADVSALLNANDLTIADGPNAGFYDVRVGGDASDAHVKAVIAAICAHKDLVRSATRKSSPE